MKALISTSLVFKLSGDFHIKVLSLRPEMFKISEEGNPQQHVVGTISNSSYMGPVIEYLISTPLGELFTTAPASEKQYPTGTRVYLHLSPEELILLLDNAE